MLLILSRGFSKIRNLFFQVLTSIFVLVFLPLVSNAEEKLTPKQDSLFYAAFYRAATELAAENVIGAIAVADSLLNNSLNSLQRIKSLMLLASLHERQGSIEKALEYAFQAEALSKSEKNDNWTMRISGFISTALRGVGLNKFAKKYLEQTETLNYKNPSASIQALIYQEKAYYFLVDSGYKTALDLLRKSIKEIDKIPVEQRTPIYIATSHTMIGDCFLNLKQYDSAQHNYEYALNSLGSEESELKGFLFSGLGEVQMFYRNFDSALYFFENAKSYAENSGNFNLRSKIYRSLEKYTGQYKIQLSR